MDISKRRHWPCKCRVTVKKIQRPERCRRSVTHPRLHQRTAVHYNYAVYVSPITAALSVSLLSTIFRTISHILQGGSRDPRVWWSTWGFHCWKSGKIEFWAMVSVAVSETRTIRNRKLLLGIGYWVQGLRCLPWMGVNFFLKDGMRVEPSTLQIVQNSANLPMVAKPLYGILSDSFYIFGQHRVPYIGFGGMELLFFLLILSALLLGHFLGVRVLCLFELNSCSCSS